MWWLSRLESVIPRQGTFKISLIRSVRNPIFWAWLRLGPRPEIFQRLRSPSPSPHSTTTHFCGFSPTKIRWRWKEILQLYFIMSAGNSKWYSKQEGWNWGKRLKSNHAIDQVKSIVDAVRLQSRRQAQSRCTFFHGNKPARWGSNGERSIGLQEVEERHRIPKFTTVNFTTVYDRTLLRPQETSRRDASDLSLPLSKDVLLRSIDQSG